DNAGDHADALALGFEATALLDMWLQISFVAVRLQPRQRPADDAGSREGVAQGQAFPAPRGGDGLVHRLAAEGPAAEVARKSALLVDPGGDIDGQIPPFGGFGADRDDLETID